MTRQVIVVHNVADDGRRLHAPFDQVPDYIRSAALDEVFTALWPAFRLNMCQLTLRNSDGRPGRESEAIQAG